MEDKADHCQPQEPEIQPHAAHTGKDTGLLEHWVLFHFRQSLLKYLLFSSCKESPGATEASAA